MSNAAPAVKVPESLNDIFLDLQGFGIEEFEEILTIESGTKTLKIRLSNIPTEDDLTSILAVEDLKGYSFFQEVKAEILSRAISCVNGIDIRKLSGTGRLVIDPGTASRRICPIHGFGIAQLIRMKSTEVLQVESGSLYPALHRPERNSCVRSEWKLTDGGQRAKFYQITRTGKGRLAADHERWQTMGPAMAAIMTPAALPIEQL